MLKVYRDDRLLSHPQYVCVCGVLWPRAGDADQEGHRPLHPRQDEKQTQQDLCGLSDPEEVRFGVRAQLVCN